MGFSQDLQFFRATLREEEVMTPQCTRGKIWRIKGKHDNFQPKRAATKVWRFWSRAPHVSQPPFLEHAIPGLENGISLRVGKKSCS